MTGEWHTCFNVWCILNICCRFLFHFTAFCSKKIKLFKVTSELHRCCWDVRNYATINSLHFYWRIRGQTSLKCIMRLSSKYLWYFGKCLANACACAWGRFRFIFILFKRNPFALSIRYVLFLLFFYLFSSRYGVPDAECCSSSLFLHVVLDSISAYKF